MSFTLDDLTALIASRRSDNASTSYTKQLFDAGPPEGVLGPRLAFLNTQQIIDRLAPNTLYAETALALLQPATRALGPVLISQLQGAVLGAPLPVTQSFVLIWPQLTGLIAATIVIFAIAYVLFQRQEIRA